MTTVQRKGTRVVSWNIANRRQPWRDLLQMDADIALLQESGPVPPEVADSVQVSGHEPWNADQYDRFAAVVKLSDRVEVEWFEQTDPIQETKPNQFAVSGIGTIAAAKVTPPDGLPFVAVSMYARWIRPHPSTVSSWRVGYSDGSAHRIISDLSAFIGSTDPSTHRILAAGDLNLIHGATDDNPFGELPARARTVMSRMDALGMEFLGPQYPDGRQAHPAPTGLPPDTKNVPTYYTTRQNPETAQNQLDYAFASRGFHESIQVRALNSVQDWGPSDHCRLLIEIESEEKHS